MTTYLCLFNHKGGVSKTTTTFHLAWRLAERGRRVVMIDADPQCNLTGLVLGYDGENSFDRYYEEDGSNLRDALRPAFDSLPRPLEAADCISVEGNSNLHLLAGHIRMSEYEVSLGIAQELSGTIGTLQNLPGSISELAKLTAEHYNADIVMFDMNPSLSSINQNIFCICDYFIVPNSPDYFSLMALKSLSRVLPRWVKWSKQASENEVLSEAAYPFPRRTPTYLGNIVQNYRLRLGAPTVGFQNWVDRISEYTSTELVPALRKVGIVAENPFYTNCGVPIETYCAQLIPDFNTLVAKSQEHATPVFALSQQQLGRVGQVLRQDQDKMRNFETMFDHLAEVVECASRQTIAAVRH